MNVERVVCDKLNKMDAMCYAEKVAHSYMQKKIRCAKYLGGGSFGKAVLICFEDDTKMVIKFILPSGMIYKETHDIKLLHDHCNIKMPNIIFVREKNNEVPFDCYAMEYIEGKPLIYDFAMYLKGKKARLALGEVIVDALHNIHKCKNEKFGDTLNPIYDSWIDCYKPFAEKVYIEAEKMYKQGKLSKKVFATMSKAWANFDKIFEENVSEACLIHGDLNVVNIMVDKNHTVSGFIDPLNSMYADKEYDLFQFYNLTGKRFYLGELYKKKYGASKHFDEKIAFYGLWNEVFCYIKSGVYVFFIMNPLIKNMKKVLKNL